MQTEKGIAKTTKNIIIRIITRGNCQINRRIHELKSLQSKEMINKKQYEDQLDGIDNLILIFWLKINDQNFMYEMTKIIKIENYCIQFTLNH
ncbi:unnamed protein product [Paramecium sonneborni]|uniref:Uncharacterized protein n=1 Tax=Paramecium sonneborni TaxID=65129 RepID=A0A8S1PD57_9CILI|nr:unnamed protein product [Paramecium sonneborni]